MTKVSTMKPFAAGDIFLGCTYLNHPTDDHAGEGRILQFDRDLVPKGTLYTEGTSHLVINLSFAPDGVLWAFDPFERVVVRVGRDGRQMPNHDFGQRGWGSVVFGKDGSIYLCEYLKGSKPYQGGQMRLLEGTEVVGYGRIQKRRPDLGVVTEYDNETAASLTGFHGVTHSAMHPSGQFITYITDLSNRVMRFDVQAGRQMPDLVTYEPGAELARKWTTGVAYLADGTLLLLRGSFIDLLDDAGRSLRTIPLDEYGYAMIRTCRDPRYCLVTNIFTGVMSRVDLAESRIVGQIDTGFAKPFRSLAGVAECPGGA
ncbi:MAG: hypothetical protein AMXMBFR8_23500 [Nevskiales bacterium]